jgi:hypothetical protein
MARTTTTVEDPDLVVTKTVDSNGRLYLGTDYESKEVRVVVETIEDDESEPDESAFARELSRKAIANQYGDDYFGENPDWADDLEDLGENS